MAEERIYSFEKYPLSNESIVEIRHMTWVTLCNVNEWVVKSPLVENNRKLLELAENARKSLWDLYQNIDWDNIEEYEKDSEINYDIYEVVKSGE